MMLLRSGLLAAGMMIVKARVVSGILRGIGDASPWPRDFFEEDSASDDNDNREMVSFVEDRDDFLRAYSK